MTLWENQSEIFRDEIKEDNFRKQSKIIQFFVDLFFIFLEIKKDVFTTPTFFLEITRLWI